MKNLKEYLLENCVMEAVDAKLKNELKQYVKTIDKYAGRISVKDAEIKLPENSHMINFTESLPDGVTFAPIVNSTVKFSRNIDQNSFDKIIQYIDWSKVERLEIDWTANNIDNLDSLNNFAKDISKHKQLDLYIGSNNIKKFNADYYIYKLGISRPDLVDLNEVHEFIHTVTNINTIISAKHIDILDVSCASDISKVKSVDKLKVEFSKNAMPKENLESYKFPQKVNDELIIIGGLLAKYYMGDGHHRMLSVDEMPAKFVDNLKKTKCPNIFTPDEWGGKRGVFNTKKADL